MKFFLLCLTFLSVAAAAYAGCREDDAVRSLKWYAQKYWSTNCQTSAKYAETDNAKNEYFRVQLGNCSPNRGYGGIFWVILREVSDGNCVMIAPPKRFTPQ